MMSLKETRSVCMELFKEGVLNMEVLYLVITKQVNDDKNKQVSIF